MKIYAVKSNYRMDLKDFHYLLNSLPSVDRDKINRYVRWEDAQRCLIGKILIRSSIMTRFGITNDAIFIEEDEFGKPFCKDVDDFHFNISHSGEWIVYVSDNGPVGIDVEEVNDIELDIVDRFFSNGEIRDIHQVDEANRMDYFYDLWTLKESYVKAEGRGLSISMDSFHIRREVDAIITNGIDENYHFKQYDIGTAYKLSVCAMSDKFPQSIEVMELDEFICHSIESMIESDGFI